MHTALRMQNLNAYLYDLNLTQQIKRGILYLFYTDQYQYRIGETVMMNLFKVNLTNRDVNLLYNTSQYYDFIVKKKEKQIWRWSEGKYFLQVIQQKVIGAGEVYRVQEGWQIPENIEPGIYKLEGRNLATPDLRLEIQIELLP